MLDLEKKRATWRRYYRRNREKLNTGRREERRAYWVANRERILKQNKEYRRLHPERERRIRLRLKYGITPEQYDDMAERQRHQCAICKTEVEGLMHIDHDHDTGAIRGLLCGKCNLGIGHFKDSPKALRAAARYLSRPMIHAVSG